jgi:hypothetical protein
MTSTSYVMRFMQYLTFLFLICLVACKRDKIVDPAWVPDFEDYHPVLIMQVFDKTKPDSSYFNNDSQLVGAGVKVLLYKNEADYYSLTPVDSAFTDSKGVVTFTNLQEEIYTYRCEYGCLKNTNNHSVILRLIPYKFNRWFINLGPSGNLSITNNTSKTIKVFVAGELVFASIPAGATQIMKCSGGISTEVDPYDISNPSQPQQISTYYINISCDSTSTLQIN